MLKYAGIVITLVALMLAALPMSGCLSGSNSASNISGTGYLAGNVTIGPLAPVERADITPLPPDPSIFTSRHLVLYQSDGKALIRQIDIQPAGYHGTYNVSLPPGTYVLDIGRDQGYGMTKNLPLTVIVEAGKITAVDVDIDTGIR